MTDPYGAFLEDGEFTLDGEADGPLAGTTFAAKDVFDIAGHLTGNGQPTWRATHPVPEGHAASVANLLNAGATLVGKTVCDEMCYSLAGDNAHYGAPINPAAPDRAVGGSSSGSAAAVAGGLCDFALGTDTGGSVRCPASFAGLYGIRPTHGRVDIAGVAPLARSFDVVGWFARDPALFARIGGVLLGGEPVPLTARRAILAEDGFARLTDLERRATEAATMSMIERLGLSSERITLAPEGLDRWFAAFRHLQALEVWAEHGDWVRANDPAFGPGVRERFDYASTLGEEDRAEHQPIRDVARRRLDTLLEGGDAVIVMPTAPVSPRRDAPADEIETFRTRTMGLTCPAGLSGCPQVSLPLAGAGAPLGVSLIGPRGSDEALVGYAARLG